MSILDDLQDLANSEAGKAGSDQLQQLLRSSEFGQVLDKVEARARDGVKAEAAKNAFNLAILSFATGAAGAALLRGTVGAIVGTGLAAFAVTRIVASSAPPKKKG